MNHKLNFVKFFACMGVIFIHIPFPELFGQIVIKAAAFAVPIFYMTAGYYAFGNNCEVVKRRLTKIVKIFISALALFFAFALLDAFMDNELAAWFDKNFTWFAIVKAVCFSTIEFAVPLWYLIAMIETYIIWYFVVKKQKEQNLLKLLPFLFVLQIVITAYCETEQVDWFWKMNFIIRALPWFLLGYYLHTDKSQKLRNIKSQNLVFLIIVGVVISIIPVAFGIRLEFSGLGYLPCAFGLFALTLKNPSQHICKPIEYIGEKLSLNIYIFHVPLSSVIGVFAKAFGIDVTSDLWGWCQPFAVLVCTVFASWVLHVMLNTLKQRRKHSTASA